MAIVVNERGGEMVLVARFIPKFDALAAAVWALYASLLGYFGGRAFECVTGPHAVPDRRTFTRSPLLRHLRSAAA